MALGKVDKHSVTPKTHTILYFRTHKIIRLVCCVCVQVSYEDVERLKGVALMDHVRIPHFLQDQARYTEQLHKIMEVNQLTDEELCSIIPEHVTFDGRLCC